MADHPDAPQVSEVLLLAKGFTFAEGPVWHPDGYLIFADVRSDRLYRIVPGGEPQLLRITHNGNGTTFDLEGSLIQCEGLGRRITRWNMSTSQVDIIAEKFAGKRLHRPNDVVCRSDGTLFFTDPDRRVPVADRELDDAAVYRIDPDGEIRLVMACEYPNGLAFSPDERTLYVANTRHLKCVLAIELDERGDRTSHRLLTDMSRDDSPGLPDGLKVDVTGRVYCTGPGGIWVISPKGEHLATLRFPKGAVNFAFGGDDLRTLFVCAHDSLFSARVPVPGIATPFAMRRMNRSA